MAGLAGMGISTPSNFDGSNVNDQLGATLNKGGLLMRMAQSKGQAAASQRGLSNSTIGIDAAQRAMVDAALPIAQQNAQQTHQRVMQGSDQQQQITMLDKQQGWQGNQNSLDRQQQLTMQGNEFKNQSALNNQQFGQQKQLNEQQAYLQAERDGLQNKFQQGILDKQGQQRMQELDKQLSSQKALNEQQNTYNSAEAQKDRAQQLTMLEKNASKDLAYMAQQVAANTHGMYLSAIDSAVSNYNERIAALEVAQDIDSTKKPEMKAGMEKELNATLQMYGTLYSNINTIRPDWTQFPTKELPKVGAGQTTGTVVAPIKPKTPTSGEVAARTTGTKPPVGTMLPTNVAAPIKPNVVTTTKVPTSEEQAARSPKKIAAPIRPIK